MDSRVARIVRKVEEAQRQKLSCFGSGKHQFTFNTPLPREDIERFEARYGITLPKDYRTFLLEAGDGGAGPYYGLLPLEEWHIAFDLTPEERSEFLARPYPFPVEHAGEVALGTEENEEDEEDSYKYLQQGIIAISHHGCDGYAYLVVTGDARGRVLYGYDDHPSFRYFVDNPDFLSWYERWIDAVLAGDDCFGLGLSGSENDLVQLIQSHETPPLRRISAVTSLRRFQGISESTRPLLVSLLKDPSPSIRKEAEIAIKHFEITTAIPELYNRIRDEDAEVRESAFRALAQFKVDDWQMIARRLLRDEDPWVIKAAGYALQEAGSVFLEDFQHLFARQDRDLQLYAIYLCQFVRDNNDAIEQILINRLYDIDEVIRFNAIQVLRRRRSVKAIPILQEMQQRETDLQLLSSIEQYLDEARNTSEWKKPSPHLSRPTRRERQPDAAQIALLLTLIVVDTLAYVGLVNILDALNKSGNPIVRYLVAHNLDGLVIGFLLIVMMAVILSSIYIIILRNRGKRG